MLTVVDQRNRQAHEDLIRAARRLRHEVFVEEMGWSELASPTGLESDQFDTDAIVEMVIEEDGRVVGYQRLLPTTQPFLLSHVYPKLCDGRPPSGPDIFEWTRFAVAASHRGDGKSLGPTALRLVKSFVEWGLSSGVRSMVVEMEPIQLLRFVACHFRAYPLGITHSVGGRDVLAIRADFDERTLARLEQLEALQAAPARRSGQRP